MGTYRPLYSFRVEHDYYDNLACRALAFRLKAGGVDLCRRIGSGFCSVSILMTEKILAAAQKEKHKTCTLRFHAPQCKWEYLLVPRDGGSPDSR